MPSFELAFAAREPSVVIKSLMQEYHGHHADRYHFIISQQSIAPVIKCGLFFSVDTHKGFLFAIFRIPRTKISWTLSNAIGTQVMNKRIVI